MPYKSIPIQSFWNVLINAHLEWYQLKGDHVGNMCTPCGIIKDPLFPYVSISYRSPRVSMTAAVSSVADNHPLRHIHSHIHTHTHIYTSVMHIFVKPIFLTQQQKTIKIIFGVEIQWVHFWCTDLKFHSLKISMGLHKMSLEYHFL